MNLCAANRQRDAHFVRAVAPDAGAPKSGEVDSAKLKLSGGTSLGEVGDPASASRSRKGATKFPRRRICLRACGGASK